MRKLSPSKSKKTEAHVLGFLLSLNILRIEAYGLRLHSKRYFMRANAR